MGHRPAGAAVPVPIDQQASLQAVPRRTREGDRHAFTAVLEIAVGAVLAGHPFHNRRQARAGLALMVRSRLRPVRASLCKSTIRWVLRRVEAEQRNQVLSEVPGGGRRSLYQHPTCGGIDRGRW